MKTKYRILRLLSLFLIGIIVKCKNVENKKGEYNSDMKERELVESRGGVEIKKSDFGKTSDGKIVEKYSVSNASGLEMNVINYGGIITSLKIPDKNGKYEDVVLGLDNIKDYEDGSPYFGAIIGRYGNRIANAKFSLDGKDYKLDANNGPNSLHGGKKGFDKVIWNVEPNSGENEASLKLSYMSPDGEGGFPGNLQITVTYTLNSNNELYVNYEATTDEKTVINLTQHTYFNLTGDFSKKVLDHIVEINADSFLPVNKTLIPTGKLKPVAGTPFDFTEPKTISKGITQENSNEQLNIGGGFDHSWILNKENKEVAFAASAYEPESGRFMEVYTSEPAIQFYTGNFLDGSLPAKGGGEYEKRSGFCMETQHYPDSPNQENFPSTILKPGETYTSETSYKFSVK